MTFTTDPPIVGDIDLIPGQDEKADLNAPAGSGGKLVTGQIPNISISSTSVVADAAERLALDVQEGDVAIQTNVSSSFIFTGGDNVAPNWQIIDFDAVGAIGGEDIAPSNVTASGNMSMQDLTVAGSINGADTSAAAAGEAITADGTGGFSFASVGGDTLSLMNEFLSQSNMQQVASSTADVQSVLNNGLIDNVLSNSTARTEFFNSSTAMNEVAEDIPAMETITQNQTIMNEVATNSTSMSELADSSNAISIITGSAIAVEEVGNSSVAQTEIENNATAVSGFNSASVSDSLDAGNFQARNTVRVSMFDVDYSVWFKSWDWTGFSDNFCVDNFGLYDGNTFLGTSLSTPQFIDDPKMGWNGDKNCGTQDVRSNYEAVVFE
jgi:hypothetical protein